MTGSKRQFGYEDDFGRQWIVNLDESVYEQSILGFAQTVLPATVSEGRYLKVTSRIPLEPRYVIATRQNLEDETVRRKFFVGAASATVWTSLATGVTIVGDDGENYQVTYLVGEKRTVIPTTDTAQTDGDVDATVAGI